MQQLINKEAIAFFCFCFFIFFLKFLQPKFCYHVLHLLLLDVSQIITFSNIVAGLFDLPFHPAKLQCRNRNSY